MYLCSGIVDFYKKSLSLFSSHGVRTSKKRGPSFFLPDKIFCFYGMEQEDTPCPDMQKDLLVFFDSFLARYSSFFEASGAEDMPPALSLLESLKGCPFCSRIYTLGEGEKLLVYSTTNPEDPLPNFIVKIQTEKLNYSPRLQKLLLVWYAFGALLSQEYKKAIGKPIEYFFVFQPLLLHASDTTMTYIERLVESSASQKLSFKPCLERLQEKIQQLKKKYERGSTMEEDKLIKQLTSLKDFSSCQRFKDASLVVSEKGFVLAESCSFRRHTPLCSCTKEAPCEQYESSVFKAILLTLRRYPKIDLADTTLYTYRQPSYDIKAFVSHAGIQKIVYVEDLGFDNADHQRILIRKAEKRE